MEIINPNVFIDVHIIPVKKTRIWKRIVVCVPNYLITKFKIMFYRYVNKTCVTSKNYFIMNL